jgi:hypothetical protein
VETSLDGQVASTNPAVPNLNKLSPTVDVLKPYSHLDNKSLQTKSTNKTAFYQTVSNIKSFGLSIEKKFDE